MLRWRNWFGEGRELAIPNEAHFKLEDKRALSSGFASDSRLGPAPGSEAGLGWGELEAGAFAQRESSTGSWPGHTQKTPASRIWPLDRKSEMRLWNPAGLCCPAWPSPRAEAAQGYRTGVPLGFPLPTGPVWPLPLTEYLLGKAAETGGIKDPGSKGPWVRPQAPPGVLGAWTSAQFMAPGAKSGCG